MDYFLRFDETAWSTQDSTIQDDDGDAEVRRCTRYRQVLVNCQEKHKARVILVDGKLSSNAPLTHTASNFIFFVSFKFFNSILFPVTRAVSCFAGRLVLWGFYWSRGAGKEPVLHPSLHPSPNSRQRWKTSLRKNSEAGDFVCVCVCSSKRDVTVSEVAVI